jgi:drug/metabolite transporter (DMT)-like permease
MTHSPESVAFRLTLFAAFASVYVVWGSTYLAILYAIEDLPPFLMAGARFLLAGSLLYAWVWLAARGSNRLRPTARQWRSATIVGGLLLLGGNGGVVWAEQYVPSSVAALLIAITPVWIVVLDWLQRGHAGRPTPAVLLGLLLGLAGVILLAGTRPGNAAAGDGGAMAIVGSLVLVGASLSWATGSVISRRMPLPGSPLAATAMQMIAGGSLLLVLAAATGQFGEFEPRGVSSRAWLSFLYLVVFGSRIGFSAYIWLLRHAPAASVATYAYVNPAVAVVLGWALAGEALTPPMLTAAALIVVAVVLITRFRSPGLTPRVAAVSAPEVTSTGAAAIDSTR